MTFEDELEAARRNAEIRGRAEGEKLGRAEGEKRKALELAAKLVRGGTMTAEDAATFAGVNPAELQRELTRTDTA